MGSSPGAAAATVLRHGFAMTACLVCAVSLARGADADPAEPKFQLFSGTDLWREGGFLYGGVVWSPDSLYKQGFALKVMAGAGEYRFHSGALATDVMGHVTQGFVTPGWRFKAEHLEITVFAGLDAQQHRLTPDDPSAGLRGGYLGARGEVDVWYEPSVTTMIAADASFSTIGDSYSGRLAYGWKLRNTFYVGPEVQAMGSVNYSAVRAGLHVTSWHYGRTEWSAAAGFMSDSDHRQGLYGRLGMLWRH